MTIDEVRNYETTFIVVPELDKNEYKDKIEHFKGIVTRKGGELINEEIWGSQKMAYEMEGHSTGYYVFFEFTAPASTIEELEQAYEFDEQVLRHLTVRLGKYAVEWNEKRRSRRKEASKA